MLILSRKTSESVLVGEVEGTHWLCKVTVLDIRGAQVKLGFEANPDIPVHRAEIWEKIATNRGWATRRSTPTSQ